MPINDDDKDDDIRERGLNGFCTRDVFAFDTYLAKVISGGVAKLRARGGSTPGNKEADEWDEILEKIESGFAKYAIDSDGGMYFGYEQTPEFIEAMELFQRHFSGLWD